MKTLSVLFALITFQLMAQQTYFIKDGDTEDPIPFVKVIPNSASPLLADIDGAFQVNPAVTSVSLHYSGYQDTTIELSNLTDSILYMHASIQNVEAVTVLPGENPAHRIMNKAIANRKKNHPMKNDAFRYSSYSKFIFDMNPEALASIPDTTTDSTLIDIRNFFNSQHLFMMESASNRTFVPPYRDHEEITAYKVSGFSDPRFSTFANNLQSFSFYDNRFNLLGAEYINPLALGGTKRYLFILQDTTVQQQDTTYTIYYRPRLGKNFNGLEGHLYINTNGFAVEKVIASPYQDTTGMQIKIIQEYAYIPGEKWFPSKLSTEVQFPTITVSGDMKDSYFTGTGHSYIENVEINPDNLPRRFNDNISLQTAEDANELSDQEWDSLRRYTITSKESHTYHTIDSLANEHKFEKRLRILNHLLEGKIPMNKFNLDLTRVINFNNYEGYRFGAGLETSDKLMKNITLGGYFGWATRDKEWKYGGFSTFHLHRRKGIHIDLKYQQDLLERGGNDFGMRTNRVFDPSAYRQFFITNMERQRLAEFSFSMDIKANMPVRLFTNYQRIEPTGGYRFSPQDSSFHTSNERVDLAETGIELEWSIGEKFYLLGHQKVSQGKKFPTIRLKAVKGWKEWFESNYDYMRFNASISQRFKFLTLGHIDVRLAADKTIGNVPLFLSQVGNGTNFNWAPSVLNSFETMKPSSFYHTEQIALYTRFAFSAFHTKATWNEPRISLHHAIGYGAFDQKTEHNIDFNSMDKGYFEGGLIIDGMYISGITGIGVGVFYNYGTYADTDWKNNIVPKIAISFNID